MTTEVKRLEVDACHLQLLCCDDDDVHGVNVHGDKDDHADVNLNTTPLHKPLQWDAVWEHVAPVAHL